MCYKKPPNDISNIKKGKIILLKFDREFEKIIFWHILASNISLSNVYQTIKIYRNVVKVQLEGTVSQAFFIGPRL